MQRLSWIIKAAVIMTLSAVVLLVVMVQFSTLQDYTSDELVYNTILSTKKDLLKGHVDRTIDEIIFLTDDMIDEGNTYSKLLAKNIAFDIRSLDPLLLQDITIKASIEGVIKSNLNQGEPIFKDFGIMVYQQSTETIIYNREKFESYVTFIEASELWLVKSSIQEEDLILHIYMNQTMIDTIVKERIIGWIRKLSIEGSGYLWVNEVINFDGGHDYAIRVVHPNLPDTEGILLSTETEDIKGNKPYKTELEGINKNGELFFTYYFKEFESDEISQKLTYAKLYEPYNWIIATGVYITDVDELRDAETFSTNRIVFLRILMFLSSLVLIVMIVLGWRMINKINGSLIEEKVHHQETSSNMQEKLDAAKDMANQDELTKLLNRRGIFERLEEELHRFKRQEYSLVVVMSDVDYFKNINDSYGHDFGDEALKHISDIIRKNLRREDILGRLGGDEFLYIMPYTTVDNAKNVVKTIGEMLKQDCLRYKDEDIFMNLSVGITKVTKDDDVDAIIKRADVAMYQSKRSGKNKISVFSKMESEGL